MTSQQQEPGLQMDSDTRRRIWEPAGLNDRPDSNRSNADLDDTDGEDYDNVIVAEVITEDPVTSQDAEDDAAAGEPIGAADATTADATTGAVVIDDPAETDDLTDGDPETSDDLTDGDLADSGVIVTTEDPAETELADSDSLADGEVLAPTEDAAVTEDATADTVPTGDTVLTFDTDLTGDTAAADDLAIAHEVPPAPENAEPVGDQLSESVSQQWHDIQSRFVDDPADAVRLAAEAADAAVSALVTALQERQSALVAGTTGDAAPDTEQLRSALREYRSFCQGIDDIERRLPEPQSLSS